MIIDDYKAVINGMVENPDTLPTGAGSLIESIGEDLLERDNLKKEVETLKAKMTNCGMRISSYTLLRVVEERATRRRRKRPRAWMLSTSF